MPFHVLLAGAKECSRMKIIKFFIYQILQSLSCAHPSSFFNTDSFRLTCLISSVIQYAIRLAVCQFVCTLPFRDLKDRKDTLMVCIGRYTEYIVLRLEWYYSSYIDPLDDMWPRLYIYCTVGIYPSY